MTDDSKMRGRLERIINPQVGLVAVFALLLSVFNTLYQVMQLASRAKPQLLQPEQILIVPDRYPTGHVFVRFAFRFAYVNLGPPQKSTVITKETLSYSLGGQTFTQKWQSFETFTGRACELSSMESEDVHPIILSGKDAASHVTYFAPRSAPNKVSPYVNFQSTETFVQKIIKQPAVEFILQSEVLNGDEILSQRCKIHLTPNEIENIQRGCATTLSCI